MIIIKTDREIELMREAGRIIAVILAEIEERIQPGISTYELDHWAEDKIDQLKGKPAFKGYAGNNSRYPYPATLCTSVNEEVVHGIPAKEKILKEGDIIGIDVGVFFKGYCADGAWTYAVGQISGEAQRLMETCRQALQKGIDQAISGNWLGDVSRAIDHCVRAEGFEIVRDLSGHGVGRDLHEDPQILNFDTGSKGNRLRKNMTIAIEPMITSGGYQVESRPDTWTVITLDRSLSAHYEHTIAIRDHGPEVLTRL